ncbi:hypothetical protein [Paracraurococcus lichenis]|uniref:hypothetical protein n=1 Tax=Paracraurococcus lichenis TaxID=3064888 RepID=UPI00351CEE91
MITSLSPGSGEKMSKHSVRCDDLTGLLSHFTTLQAKARTRTGKAFPIIVIHEAGLDGFCAYSTHRGHLFHAIVGASSTPSRAG